MLANIIILSGFICLTATMSDTASVNQVSFNKLASDYDERYKMAIEFLDDQIRKESQGFIGVKQGGRLLDYACGTGVLTQALGDDLSQCVGIDISETMVEAYNAKARVQGFTPDKRNAYLGNLLVPADQCPADLADDRFFNFDMAGVGLGFHHFDDPELAARRLSERLAPGGVLFILDLMPHAAKPNHHGVTHNGFSEQRMREVFESAGVAHDFRFKVLDEEIVMNPGAGHAHGHGHAHNHNHGHTHGHGHGGGATRHKVFFARGAKL